MRSTPFMGRSMKEMATLKIHRLAMGQVLGVSLLSIG
jgi:hypothetical protein